MCRGRGSGRGGQELIQGARRGRLLHLFCPLLFKTHLTTAHEGHCTGWDKRRGFWSGMGLHWARSEEGVLRTQNTSEGWETGSFMDLNMVQGERGGA